MTDDREQAEARARLALAGLSVSDLKWLNEIDWKPASVAPIESSAQMDDYVRREAMLNASIARLTSTERGISFEGRLAAQVGAKIADWRERGESED